MNESFQPAVVTVPKGRLERAEARVDKAEARTARAEGRAEEAKTRAESAETRAGHAETRTEFAKTRAENAEIRTEQAETRAEQAETALESLFQGETAGTPPGIRPADDSGDQSSLGRLTARQREVLREIAAGRNTKQIAALLKLSPKTVEYHRLKLMAGLNVHDIPGLVRFALRVGLVSPEG